MSVLFVFAEDTEFGYLIIVILTVQVEPLQSIKVINRSVHESGDLV
jgi:hypothetical protein